MSELGDVPLTRDIHYATLPPRSSKTHFRKVEKYALELWPAWETAVGVAGSIRDVRSEIVELSSEDRIRLLASGLTEILSGCSNKSMGKTSSDVKAAVGLARHQMKESGFEGKHLLECRILRACLQWSTRRGADFAKAKEQEMELKREMCSGLYFALDAEDEKEDLE